MWSWFQCLRWGRHSATEQPDGEETIEREDEWFSKFFCWSRLQLETHLAPHWCLWERPRELMKDRGTLLYWSHWFHPLPLKKSHPSPSPFSPPPQTGKPLLNNIIAYFILTVTSARGKKAWLNHSGVLFSPLTADCALCVWVGDFDCSFFFFTRRCLHFFFLSGVNCCWAAFHRATVSRKQERPSGNGVHLKQRSLFHYLLVDLFETFE